MSRILCAFLVCLLVGTAELCSGNENEDLVRLVVPVDWQRFADPPSVDDDYRLSVEILLNTARYNVQWAVGAANRIEADWRELSGREPHDVIRPACEAACALAVVSPRRFVPDYRVRVSRRDIEPLRLQRPDDAQVLVIVNQAGSALALNLKAPLVIHLEARLGRQIVARDDHAVQYPLSGTPALRHAR